MPKVSKRADKTIASPIRKFLPLALEAEKKGVHIYKLNVGDPDIPVPADFWKGLRSYKFKGVGYAPSPGIREHTQAWIQYYSTFGVKLEVENLLPTIGCAEAIMLSLLVMCDPGDELIVFEPLYSSYKSFATMAGIKLVPVTLKVEDNFELPSESFIRDRITKKTKGIVLVNPNNPTGTVLTDKEIRMVVRIVKSKNLFLLSDETYREIVFGVKPRSVFQYPEARKFGIVVDSVSKKFSGPGLRIGSIASFNKNIMWAILKFAMARLSAPTLEQHALIPLLKHPRKYTGPITAEYKRRKNVVYSALKKIPGVVCREPQGAFYIMAKLPLENAEDFVRFMLVKFRHNNKTVMVTPAEDFYITKGKGRSEIRIAYVLNTTDLNDAMKVFGAGLEAYTRMKSRK